MDGVSSTRPHDIEAGSKAAAEPGESPSSAAATSPPSFQTIACTVRIAPVYAAAMAFGAPPRALFTVAAIGGRARLVGRFCGRAMGRRGPSG